MQRRDAIILALSTELFNTWVITLVKREPARATRPMPPITRFVRSLDGEYYMLAEVARALRINEHTLRWWRRADPYTFGPSFMTHYGELRVYLYTPEDMERVRQAIPPSYFTARRDGRPKMWTHEERRDHCRQRMAIKYWRERAEEHRDAERHEEAARADARHRELDDALQAEIEHRRSILGLPPSPRVLKQQSVAGT